MSASAQRETRAATPLAPPEEVPMADFSMPMRHSSSTFAFAASNAYRLPRSSDRP